MSKNKDKIGDLENIALLLFEQSKILMVINPQILSSFQKSLSKQFIIN